MKNYLFPFLFLFSIVIWGQDDPLPRKIKKTHRTIGNFSGKIKSINYISCSVIDNRNTIRTFREVYDNEYLYLFDEKGNITHTYKYDNSNKLIEEEKFLYSYNENDLLIKELYYKNNHLISSYTYKYDEHANKIEETYEDTQKNYKYIRKYKYDDKNRLIFVKEKNTDREDTLNIFKRTYKDGLLMEEYYGEKNYSYTHTYFYENKKLKTKKEESSSFEGCYFTNTETIYRYNDKELPISRDVYISHKLQNNITYEYDEKGKEIKCVYTFPDDSQYNSYVTYQYDKKGNLIEENNSRLSEKIIYFYDKHDNWIKQEVYYNNKFSHIYERTFIYYE